MTTPRLPTARQNALVVDGFEQAGPGVVPVVLEGQGSRRKVGLQREEYSVKRVRQYCRGKALSRWYWISRIGHYQPMSFEFNPEIPAVLNSDRERPQGPPYHIGCSPLSFGALYDSSGGAPRRGAMRKEPQEMEVV